MKKSTLINKIWRGTMMLATAFLLTAASSAEPVAVRYVEGMLHGFLVLKTQEGAVLATGDFVQTSHADRITTKLVFHFKDGSIDDETTVYSQRSVLRLITDHHIQKGPSFPHPLDLSIDTAANQVTVRTVNKDGKEDVSTQHLQMPDDLSNGMIPKLLMNLPRGASQTKFSMLVATPKPRIIKLAITPDGNDPVWIQGSRIEAKRYLVKVEIGGVAGKVAPLVGKQPPDTRVWIIGGEAPVFIRSLGPTQQDGPVWNTELSSPTWTAEPKEQETAKQH